MPELADPDPDYTEYVHQGTGWCIWVGPVEEDGLRRVQIDFQSTSVPGYDFADDPYISDEQLAEHFKEAQA